MDDEREKRDKLELAFDRLEADSPERVQRAIRWLRDPTHRRVRVPIGIALIVMGFFGFLPIIGFEFIPLGLLVIAQDVPVLREPVGKFVLWLEEKWQQLRRKWQRKKHKQ